MPRRLIEELDLGFPHLPAALEGLRIAHLTDLHITAPRRRHAQVVRELAEVEADLIIWTGDYMSDWGDEAVAARMMMEIATHMRARLGVFGVFGNHDSGELRRRVADLPVRWLHNECVHPAGEPLELLGIHTDVQRVPDSVALIAGWTKARGMAAASRQPQQALVEAAAGRGVVSERWSGGHAEQREAAPPGAHSSSERPFRILLSHLPTFLASAGDLGVDLMFSGHTHGGQCRLPRRRALTNSCDLPLHLTSGVLRHQHTLCVVSRGLGEVTLPVRFLCPPHLPVIRLHRGPLPGRQTHHIENVRPW